ncbi:MAG: Asp23/Gls24 family envelope stress response protein [Erysipelotrichaceae bacterium]|nr:Asp23/Gls24 family envelope stress response protein [Erysipelotrichaceae bacterium]
MALENSTHLGSINVSTEAIASLAGGIVSECYGVVGMASQKMLKDGLFELLKMENFSKGVVVRDGENGMVLDLYLVITYGVKITQVVSEVQKKVKYSLEKSLDVEIEAINVFVQGVRVMD